MTENLEITNDLILSQVYILRGQRIMLSTHLAELYEVEPRTLIQAVKRNRERFPDNFMFQLTDIEFANLRSQIVISSWGGMRTAPYAFTEQGVAMLSSVLRSPRAIKVNIQIMRTFVQLRQLISTNKDLAMKIEALEARYDEQFRIIFDALRELMTLEAILKAPIGFQVQKGAKS